MITQVMTADELIQSTLRRETSVLLGECTGAQRKNFTTLFGDDVRALTSRDLHAAYESARRMVEINRKVEANRARGESIR